MNRRLYITLTMLITVVAVLCIAFVIYYDPKNSIWFVLTGLSSGIALARWIRIAFDHNL